MIVVPPGSPIDSIDALKGKTVGVVDGEVNRPVVEAIKQEYDFSKEKVLFKDLSIADVPQALHAKQVNAVLFVMPVTDKYLSIVRTAVPGNGRKKPTLVAIEAAGRSRMSQELTKAQDSLEDRLRWLANCLPSHWR